MNKKRWIRLCLKGKSSQCVQPLQLYFIHAPTLLGQCLRLAWLHPDALVDCPLWCAWVALNPAPGEEERIIEAQISAQTFDQQGFKEGETLVVNPRKARVFVADAQAA